jgi:hypothetical protein
MHYTANGEFKNNTLLTTVNLVSAQSNNDSMQTNNESIQTNNESIQTNNVNTNNQIETTFTHNGVIYIVGKDGKDFNDTLYKKDICTYFNSLNNIDLIKNSNIELPSFCVNNTIQPTIQSTIQSTIQPTIQPTMQSSDISEFNVNGIDNIHMYEKY